MTTDQPDHRLRKLERLVEVSRNLGKAQDMETLLHSTVEVVIDLIECEMASILLYEQETDLLKFVAGPLEQREALKHIRVPVEKSVAGSVYRSARSVIVQNAPHDSLIYREVEQQLNITVHNVAAVPLLFRGETVGVLEAVNTKNNRNYTEEDILILEILASQVSLFILCNVLFDEVKSAFDQVTELERLKSNFIAITSHELRTPLGLVLGHASFLNDLIDDPEIKPQF